MRHKRFWIPIGGVGHVWCARVGKGKKGYWRVYREGGTMVRGPRKRTMNLEWTGINQNLIHDLSNITMIVGDSKRMQEKAPLATHNNQNNTVND